MRIITKPEHLRKNQHQSMEKLEIISSDSPFVYLEAYKSLRTNLNFMSLNNEYKKIVVTSAIPGEGKTSVAINLAISLAENASRVLLLDCDLRKPMIQRYLEINRVITKGISSVLGGTSKLQESAYHMKNLNIDVMLSGTIPPNPVELLGSCRMAELLKYLDENYDYVICDTPPAIVTDAAVLSQYCDGTLLVIKQKYSTFEQVKTAKRNLEAAGTNIIGAILNQYNAEMDAKKSSGYYYYNNYGYGYGYGCNNQKQTND
jgi:capsular exopolysaccharide synthesis family protein